MKAILMSIKPQHVANILNEIKTLEIRKRFPSDYVGWVYIYCTKDNKQELCYVPATETFYCYPKDNIVAKQCDRMGLTFNAKVIARFWCDKVEEHRPFFHWCIEKETCLTRDDVLDYLDSKDKSVGNPKRQGKVSAIHITKLEIFDKPKDISEFWNNGKKVKGHKGTYQYSKLTNAPQSWCYIEV